MGEKVIVKEVLYEDNCYGKIPESLLGIDSVERIGDKLKGVKILYILRENNKKKVEKILDIGIENGGFVLYESTKIEDGIEVDTYLFHPNITQGLNIEYIDEDNNTFLQEAEKITKEAKTSLKNNGLPEQIHVTSAVIVKDKIIGAKTNADWHIENGCGRYAMSCPTGAGYDNCEGCQPQNHGEIKALEQAIDEGNQDELEGAKLYFYGHYWITEHCAKALLNAGISQVLIAKTFVRKYLGIKEF